MIASLLRRKDLPLTKTQRSGMFGILVEVGSRYPETPAPTDVDDDSVEWIEHVLVQHDEHDRHVIELATSVLSPDQVVHLLPLLLVDHGVEPEGVSLERQDRAAEYLQAGEVSAGDELLVSADDGTNRAPGWATTSRSNRRSAL